MAENKDKKVLNVPNIRFPEFKEEWVECRLGEVATIVGGGTPDTNNPMFWNGSIQWFTPSEIGKNKYIAHSIRKISEEGLKKSSAKLLPIGTILLSSRATIGECSINTIECTTNQGFESLIINQDNYNEFFFYLIQTKRKELIRKSCGSTFLEISSNEIKKINITKPSRKEQEKIASFLSLIDERIATQNKIIEELKQLKICVRTLIFKTLNCSWFLLSELEANGDICLKRGNIIPKHEHTDIFCYPVYSSSIQNGGLMGYNNTYMFNTELVTWSIDGGGNFFYRHKHKFNVTNVSGYMQLNEAKYNYRFVSEILLWQHSFMVFDYQTKAHPSVIKSIYKLPDISLAEQELIANIFRLLDIKLQNEITILKQYQQQKQYLLRQMFI